MNETKPDAFLTTEGTMNTMLAPLDWVEQLTIWIKTDPRPQAVIQTLRNMGL